MTPLAEKGWSDKSNSDLLGVAEAGGYDALVTTDQSLRHQQNLAQRQIGIVVLLDTNWALVRERVQQIAAAIEGVGRGKVREVSIRGRGEDRHGDPHQP